MSALFWLSYALLWIAVTFLAIVSAMLFRQLGYFVMSSGRGAAQSGIPPGKKLPHVDVPLFDGGVWSPSDWTGSARYVAFFGSQQCPECRRLAPLLLQESRNRGIDVVMLLFAEGAAEEEKARRLASRTYPEFRVGTVNQAVGATFDVAIVPFYYGLDSEGQVLAKGMGGDAGALNSFLDMVVPDDSSQRREEAVNQ